MKRAFASLQRAIVEQHTERRADSLTDAALDFFQSSQNLRNWIKNDKDLPEAVRDAAGKYVEAESEVLALCAAIANRAKHPRSRRRRRERERPLARDADARLRVVHRTEQVAAVLLQDDNDDNTFNSLPPMTPVGRISVSLVLETDSGTVVDALAFATDCVKEWDFFLGGTASRVLDPKRTRATVFRDMGKVTYPPVGRCIYCGSPASSRVAPSSRTAASPYRRLPALVPWERETFNPGRQENIYRPAVRSSSFPLAANSSELAAFPIRL
jgi:uncharacterized protein (DUF2384 family)